VQDADEKSARGGTSAWALWTISQMPAEQYFQANDLFDLFVRSGAGSADSPSNRCASLRNYRSLSIAVLNKRTT
jgi:hypothetical protein